MNVLRNVLGLIINKILRSAALTVALIMGAVLVSSSVTQGAKFVGPDNNQYRWGMTNGGFAVSAKLWSFGLSAHTSVLAIMALKNMGTSAVQMTRKSNIDEFNVSITTRNGKLIARRADLPPSGSECSAGCGFSELQPHEIEMDTIDLALFYKFVPGRYILWVHRRVRSAEGKQLANLTARPVSFLIH